MALIQRFHSITLEPVAVQSIIVEHVCWARLVTAKRSMYQLLTCSHSFQFQVMRELRLLTMLTAIRGMDKEDIMRKIVKVKGTLIQGKES